MCNTPNHHGHSFSTIDSAAETARLELVEYAKTIEDITVPMLKNKTNHLIYEAVVLSNTKNQWTRSTKCPLKNFKINDPYENWDLWTELARTTEGYENGIHWTISAFEQRLKDKRKKREEIVESVRTTPNVGSDLAVLSMRSKCKGNGFLKTNESTLKPPPLQFKASNNEFPEVNDLMWVIQLTRNRW